MTTVRLLAACSLLASLALVATAEPPCVGDSCNGTDGSVVLKFCGTPITPKGDPTRVEGWSFFGRGLADKSLVNLPEDLANLALCDPRTLPGDALRKLKNLGEWQKIKTLNLSLTNVTDLGLPVLACFPDLENLYLASTVVTDNGLAVLRGRKFSRLDISDTSICPKQIAAFIHSRPNIGTLTVSPSQVDDDVLQALHDERLFHIMNFATVAKADGQADDSRLPGTDSEVAILKLSKTRTKNSGLQWIVELKSLSQLELSEASILMPFGSTEKDHLADLKTLTRLTLSKARLEDGSQATLKDLVSLDGLSNLTYLDFSGIAAFKKETINGKEGNYSYLRDRICHHPELVFLKLDNCGLMDADIVFVPARPTGPTPVPAIPAPEKPPLPLPLPTSYLQLSQIENPSQRPICQSSGQEPSLFGILSKLHALGLENNPYITDYVFNEFDHIRRAQEAVALRDMSIPFSPDKVLKMPPLRALNVQGTGVTGTAVHNLQIEFAGIYILYDRPKADATSSE